LSYNLMLNSWNFFIARQKKKRNILTLVLSEKHFSERKNTIDSIIAWTFCRF
jgi:hypothetical protein